MKNLYQYFTENPEACCVIGLNTEAERLVDIRKNSEHFKKPKQGLC